MDRFFKYLLIAIFFHNILNADLQATADAIEENEAQVRNPSFVHDLIGIDLLRFMFGYFDAATYKQASLVSTNWLRAARHQNSKCLFNYRVSSAPENIEIGKLLPIGHLSFFLGEEQFVISALNILLKKLPSVRTVFVSSRIVDKLMEVRESWPKLSISSYPEEMLPLYVLLQDMTPQRFKTLQSLTKDFAPCQLTELKDILEPLDVTKRWSTLESASLVIIKQNGGAERLKIIRSCEDLTPDEMLSITESIKKLGQGLRGMEVSRLIAFIKNKGAEKVKEASPDMSKLLTRNMTLDDRIMICNKLVSLEKVERSKRVRRSLQSNGGKAVSPRFVVQSLEDK